MFVGIGFSQEMDSALAGRNSAEQAVRQSGEPVVSFLFTTNGYDQEKIFQEVKKVIGSSRLIGACVPGIIFGTEVITRGVGVCTIAGPEIQAATCIHGNIANNSYKKGEDVGKSLLRSGIEKGTVFIFPDGFAANISMLLRGMYNVLGPKYNYIGGGTGDNINSYRTHQFTEQGIGSDSVAAALIKGINFKTALGHGWEPAGEPMMVTRADGKKVYELDGLPAFERYSSYFGGIDRDKFTYFSMKHPLGIPCIDGSFLIRDPLKVEDDNGIIFVTEVPQNTVATIMKGEFKSLIEAAGTVSKKAVISPHTDKVVFLFDCISRFLLMGENFKKELVEIYKNMGNVIPLIGVLTFGEISSISGTPFFYNKTLIIAGG